MHTQRKFGLIGRSLSHSFSPQFFTDKFKSEKIEDAIYLSFELKDIREVRKLMSDPLLLGFNITIPYKKDILAYADVLSDEVKDIGAANTFKRLPNGKWKAFNTDVYGFEKSFKPFLSKHHKKALILGTGGASIAVQYVIKMLNIEYTLVSRTPDQSNQIAYTNLDQEILENHHIIINTTPVGTFPDIDACPDIPFSLLTGQHYLYDLVYNPKLTTFLLKGKQHKAVIKNGLEMLHLQAELAWDIWNKS